MQRGQWVFLIIATLVVIVAVIGLTSQATLAAPASTSTPSPTIVHRPAISAELQAARATWVQSAHADTYDNGMGANSTCARCKSPQNWDPAAPAAEEALNCASCKRVAGMPRPDLTAGIPVAQAEWHSITCEICHQPVGDSYFITVTFWNNQLKAYEFVADPTALCARCHEGRHGFEVLSEQTASAAHQGWPCTRCHGAHGQPVTCQDCHDPATGDGAAEHERHVEVNCTACHDAGHLGLWQETNPASRHAGEIIPVRFAHTLTSWPSHNLQRAVACQRCHHPRGTELPAVAAAVACDQCHANGAVLNWCTNFERDADPNATLAQQP